MRPRAIIPVAHGMEVRNLASVSAGGRTAFANLTAASVPASLAGTVGAVLGLDTLMTMTPAPLQKPTNPPSSCAVSGVPYGCEYNPQGFWKAYGATGTPAGSKTPIAIFAEGNLTQVVKDLRQEEAANGLPKVPVAIDHTGVASSDTSAVDEWDLDSQYSTGMAGAVKSLTFYDSPTLTDSDLAIAFADFAAADRQKAASASFGECEANAFLDGSMLIDDEAFAEAAAQGQTVFASAGRACRHRSPSACGRGSSRRTRTRCRSRRRCCTRRAARRPSTTSRSATPARTRPPRATTWPPGGAPST